nr:MAG TPA: hypothetical protein [Caudoviricetes sp.]
MLTIKLWKDILCDLCIEPLDFMLVVIGVIFTIPLDLLLFPVEVIAFVIYKILG